MKTAIYQKADRLQVVLTPETEFEKSALKLLSDADHGVEIYTGSFYDCQGGWSRQGGEDNSTLIVCNNPSKAEQTGV